MPKRPRRVQHVHLETDVVTKAAGVGQWSQQFHRIEGVRRGRILPAVGIDQAPVCFVAVDKRQHINWQGTIADKGHIDHTIVSSEPASAGNTIRVLEGY